jgi:uncharacterized protein
MTVRTMSIYVGGVRQALAARAESLSPLTNVMDGVSTAMVRAPGGVQIGFSGPTD